MVDLIQLCCSILLVKQQKFSPVRYNLSAVYIDHQLQADSTTWVNTNREICASYNVNYESYAVEILKDKSKSIESLARIARYGQLSKIILNSKTVLITAHHLDDQAETFFYYNLLVVQDLVDYLRCLK